MHGTEASVHKELTEGRGTYIDFSRLLGYNTSIYSQREVIKCMSVKSFPCVVRGFHNCNGAMLYGGLLFIILTALRRYPKSRHKWSKEKLLEALELFQAQYVALTIKPQATNTPSPTRKGKRKKEKEKRKNSKSSVSTPSQDLGSIMKVRHVDYDKHKLRSKISNCHD